MKTSEFKKRVRELGYETKNYEREISAWNDHTGFVLAKISKIRKKELSLKTSYYPLIKLCIEYAETPISEREDDKKYTVVLPDPKNGYGVNYMLTKQNGDVTILRAHRCHLTPLTEAEIKRNHEYLWQFAKEVAE